MWGYSVHYITAIIQGISIEDMHCICVYRKDTKEGAEEKEVGQKKTLGMNIISEKRREVNYNSSTYLIVK